MAASTGRRARDLGAFAASLVLNLLFLAGMAFGVRVVAPPPEIQPVQLTLLPPVVRPPQPKTQSRTPARAPPTLRVLTRPPDAKPAPAVATAPAAVPATIGPPARQPGPGEEDGVQATLKETVGCDDPDAYHLTPAQRAVCDQRFLAHAREGQQYFLNIPDAKRAAFDRNRRCHQAASGGVPFNAGDDGVGGLAGVGSPPRWRDCGPGDR